MSSTEAIRSTYDNGANLIAGELKEATAIGAGAGAISGALVGIGGFSAIKNLQQNQNEASSPSNFNGAEMGDYQTSLYGKSGKGTQDEQVIEVPSKGLPETIATAGEYAPSALVGATLGALTLVTVFRGRVWQQYSK